MNTVIIELYANQLYQSVKFDNFITFFTPTYQRVSFLSRIYAGLLRQTSKNFVWIIVNDGSTDETDNVCKKFVEENKIPILYINKENGGKHSAFKVALERCKTEFFQCMDDDDIYSELAVETYLNEWAKIQDKSIGAIRTLAQYKSGKYAVSGCDIESKLGSSEDCTTLEMNYIRNCHQENWTCYRTEALRQIDLFSEGYWLEDKHKFFLESIWQGRFARRFKCRYLYITLRTYTDDAEFSLIRSNKSINHYLNMFINSKMVLDEQYDYIVKSTLRLIRTLLLIEFLRYYLDIKQSDLISNTNSTIIKIWLTMVYPFSFLGKRIINSSNR